MEPVDILADRLNAIARGTIETTPQMAVALAVLLLTFGCNRIATVVLRRVLRATRLRQSLGVFFDLLLSILIWLLGLTIAAVVLFPGLTPAGFLAGLGLGAVAIGFAFREIFENFLAGILILFRREMRIGDHIECREIEGRVDRIAIRESHIRQTDGQLVIVPNSILFKNPVTIRTDGALRRVTILCGVAYGEDLDTARDVIRNALRDCDTVEQDGKPIQIFAQEFGDFAINFEVTWWTGSRPVEVRRSRDEVIAAVRRALDEAGIEIPFPYRAPGFKDPLKMNRPEA